MKEPQGFSPAHGGFPMGRKFWIARAGRLEPGS